MEQLTRLIAIYMPVRSHGGGREQLPIRTQLLVTVYYMANQATVRRIADKFGMSESSVIKSRRNVTGALNTLLETFVKWPAQLDIVQTSDAFLSKSGISGIIGAIDGTHIPISAPFENHEYYVNRKGFHSILMQAVCNNDMLFTDVYVGWLGSVHDARVFQTLH